MSALHTIDAVARLEARVRLLEAALRPFAHFADYYVLKTSTVPQSGAIHTVHHHKMDGEKRELLVEDYLTARAVLAEGDQ